jgi:hypothetical protein
MKATVMQYFFARNWPLKIWLAGIALASAFMAGRACEPTLSSLHDWHFVLLLVWVILVAPALAYFSSLLVVWIFLAPPFIIFAGA